MQPQHAMDQARRHIVGGKDVDTIGAGKVERRHVAGMRSTADDIRRAQKDRDAAGMGRLGRLGRGGKFRERRATRGGLRDMVGAGVVMASDQDGAPPRDLDDARAVGRRVAPLRLAVALEQRIHLGVRHAVLALVVAAILGDIRELPLAGRMVHERDDLHPRMIGEVGKGVEQISMAELGAQMDEMLAPQRASGGRLIECPNEVAQGNRPGRVPPEIADRQRVADRGDAGGRDLGIVCHHGAGQWPGDTGARRDMFLEIVRMEFDHPGQDEIVATVDGAVGDAPSRAEFSDASATDDECAGHDLRREDDARIGEDRLVTHAALSTAVQSISEVATASRASGSWKIPRIAAPRSLASRTRPTTILRFSASSDAVGSSSRRTG